MGNTLMGDDGVGVRVAEVLSARDLGPDIDVVSGGTAGMALTDYFATAPYVVVVDAIAAGDEPGSVYRFRPEDAGILSLRSHTSHGLSLPNIIWTAQLKGANPNVIVYAVQIGDITCGFDTLTAEVETRVPEVADMVAEEAARLAREG
jgi:hydrogenase maturation protease